MKPGDWPPKTEPEEGRGLLKTEVGVKLNEASLPAGLPNTDPGFAAPDAEDPNTDPELPTD